MPRIYDLSGNLIAEAERGRITKEYIYIDRLPVADIDGNDLYYIHTDHLGAPQKMTDDRQRIVWDRVGEPFGETAEIRGNVTMNLRYPGQYHDEETGLDYNYFRSYDPTIGRYTQSDPIGLAGGINTFTYAGGNPILMVDPYGLYSMNDFQLDYSTAEINALQALAGFSDSLTFGETNCWARNQLGTNYADPSSTAYKAGAWLPAVVGGARLAYAGTAKVVSMLPGVSGIEAAATRNFLKTVFRLGIAPDYKMYTAAELLQKYGTDAAIKTAAGRTNMGLNTLGATALAGSIANNSISCEK